jgi:chitin synthase
MFSLIHYIAYASTYIHTIIIYAFCRIDDLTWGTKGLDKD